MIGNHPFELSSSSSLLPPSPPPQAEGDAATATSNSVSNHLEKISNEQQNDEDESSSLTSQQCPMEQDESDDYDEIERKLLDSIERCINIESCDKDEVLTAEPESEAVTEAIIAAAATTASSTSLPLNIAASGAAAVGISISENDNHGDTDDIYGEDNKQQHQESSSSAEPSPLHLPTAEKGNSEGKNDQPTSKQLKPLNKSVSMSRSTANDDSNSSKDNAITGGENISISNQNEEEKKKKQMDDNDATEEEMNEPAESNDVSRGEKENVNRNTSQQNILSKTAGKEKDNHGSLQATLNNRNNNEDDEDVVSVISSTSSSTAGLIIASKHKNRKRIRAQVDDNSDNDDGHEGPPRQQTKFDHVSSAVTTSPTEGVSERKEISASETETRNHTSTTADGGKSQSISKNTSDISTNIELEDETKSFTCTEAESEFTEIGNSSSSELAEGSRNTSLVANDSEASESLRTRETIATDEDVNGDNIIGHSSDVADGDCAKMKQHQKIPTMGAPTAETHVADTGLNIGDGDRGSNNIGSDPTKKAQKDTAAAVGESDADSSGTVDNKSKNKTQQYQGPEHAVLGASIVANYGTDTVLDIAAATAVEGDGNHSAQKKTQQQADVAKEQRTESQNSYGIEESGVTKLSNSTSRQPASLQMSPVRISHPAGGKSLERLRQSACANRPLVTENGDGKTKDGKENNNPSTCDSEDNGNDGERHKNDDKKQQSNSDGEKETGTQDDWNEKSMSAPRQTGASSTVNADEGSASASSPKSPRAPPGSRADLKVTLPTNSGPDEALPPLFNQPTLDFLETKSIRTAEDLQNVDPRKLTKDLYNSEGYQLGCSLTAWCFGKEIDSLVALKLAGRCIKRLKMELGKRTEGQSHKSNRATTTSSIPDEVSTSNKSAQPAVSDAADEPTNAEPCIQEKQVRREAQKKKTPETTPLSDLLSISDCEFLREECGAVTASDFLELDKVQVVKKFQKMIRGQGQEGRVREGFGAGIVYAWCVRVRESFGLRDGNPYYNVKSSQVSALHNSSPAIPGKRTRNDIQGATTGTNVYGSEYEHGHVEQASVTNQGQMQQSIIQQEDSYNAYSTAAVAGGGAPTSYCSGNASHNQRSTSNTNTDDSIQNQRQRYQHQYATGTQNQPINSYQNNEYQQQNYQQQYAAGTTSQSGQSRNYEPISVQHHQNYQQQYAAGTTSQSGQSTSYEPIAVRQQQRRYQQQFATGTNVHSGQSTSYEPIAVQQEQQQYQQQYAMGTTAQSDPITNQQHMNDIPQISNYQLQQTSQIDQSMSENMTNEHSIRLQRQQALLNNISQNKQQETQIPANQSLASYPASQANISAQKISSSSVYQPPTNSSSTNSGAESAIDLTLCDDIEGLQEESKGKDTVAESITVEKPGHVSPGEQRQSGILRTPLCYGDATFLRSQGIVTDEQLLNCNPKVLGFLYDKYRSRKGVYARTRAAHVVQYWLDAALKTLGRANIEQLPFTSPHFASSENPEEEDPPLMDNVQDLCKMTIDPETGLPRKIMTVFDCANEILYDFVIDVRQSTIPGAGHGAFLTYKGARLLKEEKRRPFGDNLPAVTRYAAEAVLPNGNGLTVKVCGRNIHGDEHLMGEGDGAGMWKQYSAGKDFVDSDDNITFCSYEHGCGLLELGRYGPWLPSDRKTNLVFGMKDFLFSHEPSGWRFDVPETLDGYEQVIDFTNDVTGEPHKEARSNVTTFVNEIGHSSDLAENVVSRDDRRTVFYYICLKKPIEKDETVELFVDYSETYEYMRERKGYGKANITSGVKSDSDDYWRLQRNIKERYEMEKCISSYTEKDIENLLTYIRERVLSGINAATLTSVPCPNMEHPVNMANPEKCKHDIFLRQWVARRRLHWVSTRIGLQAETLFSRHGISLEDSSSADVSGNIDESPFAAGMVVFVNDWVPEYDPRPPYTGLAMIEKIEKLPNGRRYCTLSLEKSKCMKEVPEEVLTHPTESELSVASRRLRSEMDQKKDERTLPERVVKINDTIQQMIWTPQLNRTITSCPSLHKSGISENKTKMKDSLFGAMEQEFSEEILYSLYKEKKLTNPYDRTEWCPLSSMLLRRILRDMTRYNMSDTYGTLDSLKELAEVLCKRARAAARIVRTAETSAEEDDEPGDHMNFLAFEEKQVSRGKKFICAFSMDSTVQTFQGIDNCQCVYIDQIRNTKMRINVQWYIMQQIVSIVHALASTVSWGNDQIYSLQRLCSSVGVDASLATAPLKRG